MLRFVLRWLGTVTGLAIFAVILPYSWMDAIHQWLGLGKLPDAPVVGYLARSTSAFYALLGGLAWVLSSDVQRYRRVVCYLGLALTVFGLMLFGIDWREGLPRFWALAEGPIDLSYGLVILWLSRRIEREMTKST